MTTATELDYPRSNGPIAMELVATARYYQSSNLFRGTPEDVCHLPPLRCPWRLRPTRRVTVCTSSAASDPPSQVMVACCGDDQMRSTGSCGRKRAPHSNGLRPLHKVGIDGHAEADATGT